ncbi:MAG: RyR domain-containing protein [Ruthenibacterium sp.]
MTVGNYVPHPIDTSDVEIPKKIAALAEKLAKNTHEVWSTGRIAEGWQYGLVRDDMLKTHPSLRPYEELSDSEKDYDRKTSMQTICLILKLGYKIEK